MHAEASPAPEGHAASDATRPLVLADQIRACRLCRTAPLGPPLPVDPRPIVVISPKARLVIASQAPGARAFASGVPFQDPSGERLRAWMGLSPATFYDADRVMIVPMGFCFPGHDSQGGDRPPRRECRLAWHEAVFAAIPQVETVLAVGLHAIRYHLGRLQPAAPQDRSLTALVERWRDLFARGTRPRLLPLPHPSWRNTAWLTRHPFFAEELLPVLRAEVRRLTGPEAADGVPGR